MKPLSLKKQLKQTFLAIPAAALMLGVSQAGTTIGLNFQAWYYDSGNTPQTIGFNNGYSNYAATGLPVTATAFGVDVTNWYNADPVYTNLSVATFNGANTFAGGLSCNVTAPDGAYFSGAGCIPPNSDSTYENGPGYPSYAPGVWCPPGNDEVLWGEIFGDANNPFFVSVSGLAAKFPNGYVIQSMSAFGGNSSGSTEQASLPGVNFTDGTTTNAANCHLWYIQNGPGGQWPVTTAGLSDSSGVFAADTLNISAQTGVSNVKSTLAGFIITDQPVISQPPVGSTNVQGSTLVLTAGVIGIPPLSYQWRTNGVPIAGANSSTYSKANSTPADNGNYDLVVANGAGSITSSVVIVSVFVPIQLTYDANPGTSGTQLDGSGSWDSTTPNWWNGTSDVAWSPYSFATFGGGGSGAYTVTLNNSINASGLTFSNGSYTITNATGAETITMVSPSTNAPQINYNNDTEIDAPLAGASGLLINGTGTLTLTGYSTYTGSTTVSNGTLNLPTDISGGSTSLRTSAINLMPGTTLTCISGAFGWYANNNAIGLTINIDEAACQPNGAFGVAYMLTGGSIAGGSHRLDLGASGGFNASVTTYPSAITSVINPGDGNAANDLILLRDDSSQTSYTFTVAAGTTPSGVDLDVQVPINQNTAACSLVKAGSGTLQITGPNTYNGSTTVSNGTLVINGTVNTSALTVNSGATLITSTNLTAGTLTLNPSSTTVLVMNRAAGPSSYGNVQGMSTATLGGTLVVTNLGGTFQNGDTFTLFNAASFSGNFTTVTLPTLPSGQNWSWSPSTGVLTVVSTSGTATFTWDANPGTSGTQLDGSGSWDSTTPNWWNGTSDVAWAPAAIAAFGGGGGGAYTVTLNNNVNASGLTFNNGNYTIANATGAETITMASPSTNAPQINYNNDTEIDAPLAGASGLLINGTGTLTLTGYSTYTGSTTVSNGTLNLPTSINNGSTTSLKTSVINLMPGSALVNNYYAFGWLANNNAIGLTININGATCQPNGSFGIAYTLTGGSIAGGSQRLDLGASGGFNSSITSYPSATTSVINPGGGLIMLRNDSGQTNYTFTMAAGTTPSGVDLDVQVPINQNGSSCAVVKAGSGVLQLSAYNTYSGTTTVSNGTLLVNGGLQGASAVQVNAGGTLSGTGSINGPVTVDGTLTSETNNLGALYIYNALTLDADSKTILAIDRTAGTSSYGSVQGITAAAFSGTLVVASLGGTFQNGDTFNLFNASSYTGNFSSTVFPSLNSGLGWNWDPTSGTLSVVPITTNTNPTNIVVAASSSNINLSWPTDHIGWRLLVQTNNLAAGVSPNTNDWMTVNGSATTNQISIPIDATKPTEFYRLIYP